MRLDKRKSDAATAAGKLESGFQIDRETLDKLVEKKNIRDLHSFGGVDGVAKALKTSPEDGLCNDEREDIASRRRAFGTNTLKNRPKRGFLHFVWRAFLGGNILILIACGAVSLGFDIKVKGLKEGWKDGGSIFIGVLFSVLLIAISKYWQSRQEMESRKHIKNIKTDVVRCGLYQQIQIFDIVVGDVVYLKPGDRVPAHGLLIEAHSLKLQPDEASIKGEGDHKDLNLINQDPFLLSGTKVVDGFARMLVTSVGTDARCGKVMSQINNDSRSQTPSILEAQHEELDMVSSYVGVAIVALYILAMIVSIPLRKSTGKNNEEELDVMTRIRNIVSDVVTFLTAAYHIPDPWKLSSTLARSNAMKKVMTDNAMVLKHTVLETLCSANTICTSKTAILEVNRMKVAKFWLAGKESVEEGTYLSVSSPILKEGIALNSIGVLYNPTLSLESDIAGSPTEKALLSWAIEEMKINMEEVKRSHDILQVEAFNSDMRRSGILTKRKADNTVHVHWKGAAELILAMCSRYYDASGIVRSLDWRRKFEFEKIVEGMAASSLSCIAFAHKQVLVEGGEINEQEMLTERLVLLGVVGISNPFHPGVKDAVTDCRNAGVIVRMITGDNILTAKAIATECGILNLKGIAIEGRDFRYYSPEERREKVEKICVMASSSPSDKLLMIQCLKEIGHVVAVTGDETDDASTMIDADIRVSMGIQDTEVTEESSDIVILNSNFASIPNLLRWGRCVYSNVQKVIQFQQTVKFAALIANYVGSFFAKELPLTTMQLLWVTLVTDTLASVALSMENPTGELMKLPPVKNTDPLVTNIMMRNIFAQALYQVALLLTLHFKGTSIFGINNKRKVTLLFNSYVLCLVFNEFNARKPEKKNVFKKMHHNKLFMAVIAVTIVLQILFVEILIKLADTERLNWSQWGQCIGIAALTLPLGWVAKCIPVPETQLLTYLVTQLKPFHTSISQVLQKMLGNPQQRQERQQQRRERMQQRWQQRRQERQERLQQRRQERREKRRERREKRQQRQENQQLKSILRNSPCKSG